MEPYRERELLEFEKELLEGRRGKKQRLYQYLFAVMCFCIILLAGVLIYIITTANSAF